MTGNRGKGLEELKNEFEEFRNATNGRMVAVEKKQNDMDERFIVREQTHVHQYKTKEVVREK